MVAAGSMNGDAVKVEDIKVKVETVSVKGEGKDDFWASIKAEEEGGEGSRSPSPSSGYDHNHDHKPFLRSGLLDDVKEREGSRPPISRNGSFAASGTSTPRGSTSKASGSSRVKKEVVKIQRPLIDDLPVAWDAAHDTFDVLEACVYENKKMGLSREQDEMMVCDCSYDKRECGSHLHMCSLLRDMGCSDEFLERAQLLSEGQRKLTALQAIRVHINAGPTRTVSIEPSLSSVYHTNAGRIHNARINGQSSSSLLLKAGRRVARLMQQIRKAAIRRCGYRPDGKEGLWFAGVGGYTSVSWSFPYTVLSAQTKFSVLIRQWHSNIRIHWRGGPRKDLSTADDCLFPGRHQALLLHDATKGRGELPGW